MSAKTDKKLGRLYRKSARVLLRDWQGGGDAAITRVEAWLGIVTQLHPSLMRAQYVVARENGFASWGAMLLVLEEEKNG